MNSQDIKILPTPPISYPRLHLCQLFFNIIRVSKFNFHIIVNKRCLERQ